MWDPVLSPDSVRTELNSREPSRCPETDTCLMYGKSKAVDSPGFASHQPSDPGTGPSPSLDPSFTTSGRTGLVQVSSKVLLAMKNLQMRDVLMHSFNSLNECVLGRSSPALAMMKITCI